MSTAPEQLRGCTRSIPFKSIKVLRQSRSQSGRQVTLITTYDLASAQDHVLPSFSHRQRLSIAGTWGNTLWYANLFALAAILFVGRVLHTGPRDYLQQPWITVIWVLFLGACIRAGYAASWFVVQKRLMIELAHEDRRTDRQTVPLICVKDCNWAVFCRKLKRPELQPNAR